MSSESSHVHHKLHFDSFVSILPSSVKSKILQYSLFIFVSYRHDIYYSNQSDTIFHTNATQFFKLHYYLREFPYL